MDSMPAPGLPGALAAPVVDTPTYRLFGIWSITLATIFGSPLAGGALMAMNYRRVGQRGTAWRPLAAGAAATAALCLLPALLPVLATPGVAIAGVLAMRQLATNWQGWMLSDHQAKGGKMLSPLLATAIGIAGGVLLVGVIGTALIVIDREQIGTHLQFTAEEEIYYAGTATEADARSLGQGLRKAGVFAPLGTSTGPKTVFLSKRTGQTIISVVVTPEAWTNPRAARSLWTLGRQLAESVGGKPLTIRFVDEELATKLERQIE